MEYYLVCDGGGTKTDFLIFDKQGKVYSYTQQSGSNVNFIEQKVALESVLHGIERCTQMARIRVDEISRITLFIPGFKSCLVSLRKNLNREDILLFGDEKNAFYGALGLPYGIVVLSGTGSFAVGRDKKGKEAVSGGWGPLFGDYGSGYHIGVLCLAKVAWLHDNKIEGTLLEKLCLKAMNVEKAIQLRVAAYAPEFTRKKVAALCKIVEEAARQSDQYALEVLVDAVKALASEVKTITGQLQADGLPVSITGGVVKMGPLFEDLFKAQLLTACPQCHYQTAKYDPLVGAALCLLSEQIGCDIKDCTIAENLMKYKTGDSLC